MSKCSFDKNVITISQYGGVVHGFEGKEYAAYSHFGYRATDFSIAGENKLYAPCALKCVFHNYIKDFKCVASVFETIGSVSCADGTPRELTFMMLHGGTEHGGSFGPSDPLSSIPELKKTYKKNDHIYKAGLDGLGSGAHIHVDILNGHITNNGQETITESELRKYVELYVQPYFPMNTYGLDAGKSLNFHEVFFDTNGIAFSTYADPGFTSAYEVWGRDVSFTKSSIEEETPFNPAGKKDGEYEYEGDHYYVINQDFAYGWQPETAEPDMQKYYDKSNGGRRIDNNWAGYYYFTDENGFIRKNQWVEKPAADWFYLGDDGKFVTGWQFVKRSNTSTSEAWFYFNLIGVQDENGNYQDGYVPTLPAGQMLRAEWIAGKDAEGNVVWYYVKDGGEMAANETVNINGTEYRFDENGVCLNP